MSESESIMALEKDGKGHDDPKEDPAALLPPPTRLSDIPDEVLSVIFSKWMRLIDVRNAKLVCKEWNWVIGEEVWRKLCLQRMSMAVLHSELLSSSCPTYYTRLRAFEHAWNPLDASRNMYLKPDGFTIQRDDMFLEFNGEGARGKLGFSSGTHVWELKWEGSLGTEAVVGVATLLADIGGRNGNRNREPVGVGMDDQSWGWNLAGNALNHNGVLEGRKYPDKEDDATRYQAGQKLKVILNCEECTLSFEKEGEFLGVAFNGLPPGADLYPVVSARMGNPEITMVYLGPRVISDEEKKESS